jgi:RNA polymerase sigma factor (sigma-70 family)
MTDGSTRPSEGDHFFPSTCWGTIQAGDAAALEMLARRYWRPIHAYLRTALHRDHHDAEDLTQAFLARIIDGSFLARADRTRGRFRAFLKTALRHFAHDELRAARAQRRGGDLAVISLSGQADERAAVEPADPRALTPERALDRAWRDAVLGQALERTLAELAGAGRPVVCNVFHDYFFAGDEDVDYKTLALRHGISTSDVSNYLMRAKRAWRDHVRTIVMDTVGAAGDLEDEVTWLLGGSDA